MNLKKLIAIGMFIVLAMTATGCGNSSKQTVDANTSDGSAQQASNATSTDDSVLRDGKMTELRVVFPGVSSAPTSLEEVEAGINAIVGQYMDATVKLDILEWGVFGDQQNLILSSGEDVALMFSYMGTKTYASNGQAYDITELLDKYGKDSLALLANYVEACKVNGRLYGLPTFHEYTQGTGLIARTDMLQEMNVNPDDIKTWDDVDKLLQTVKEKYPSVNPLVPADGTYGVFGYMAKNNYDEVTGGVGIMMDDKEVKAVNIYDTQMYRDFAQKAYDLKNKGYVIPDATTVTETRSELLAADVAFGYIGMIHPGTATQELKNAGKEMTTMSITNGILTTNTVQFAQYMVPSSCTTPEKAVKLLDLLMTNKDINNLLSFGIEGKDYVIKDEANDIIGYPEGVENSTVGWNNETWIVGNGSLGHIWESDNPDIWNQYISMNEAATPSPLYGFTYDPINVKNEITAVTNVISKYRLVIEAGYADPKETVDQMVAELESAGIQNIIDDAQSQIDTWLKK